MRTVIKIEDIGGGKRNRNIIPSLAWVAEIVGFDPIYKFKRKFIKPNAIDIRQSNSVGTRGIYKYYFLGDNRLYNISSRVSWQRRDIYFCFVKEGKIIKITEGEAEEWIYDHLV